MSKQSSSARPDQWATAITSVERDKILIRGYAIDELMGRHSFGDTVYLLLTGELPSPAVSRVMEALLVSSLDHGALPPSTISARTVSGTGAPLRAAAAAGVLALGSPLGGGGSIEACMRFLDEGLALLDQHHSAGQLPPGYGHRLHKRDPRAARLMQLAFELELEGGHTQFARAVEQELDTRQTTLGLTRTSLNSDGAIAAVAGDLGLDAETATLLFTISRVPGLVAHALEEQRRQPAMRQIDPSKHYYDGPSQRSLPQSSL